MKPDYRQLIRFAQWLALIPCVERDHPRGRPCAPCAARTELRKMKFVDPLDGRFGQVGQWACLYCALPGGNEAEFPEIDAELKRRRVKAEFSPMDGGGRVYRIPSTELHKLPADRRGPYLGDDHDGHAVYPMVVRSAEGVNWWSSKTEWKKVK